MPLRDSVGWGACLYLPGVSARACQPRSLVDGCPTLDVGLVRVLVSRCVLCNQKALPRGHGDCGGHGWASVAAPLSAPVRLD